MPRRVPQMPRRVPQVPRLAYRRCHAWRTGDATLGVPEMPRLIVPEMPRSAYRRCHARRTGDATLDRTGDATLDRTGDATVSVPEMPRTEGVELDLDNSDNIVQPYHDLVEQKAQEARRQLSQLLLLEEEPGEPDSLTEDFARRAKIIQNQGQKTKSKALQVSFWPEPQRAHPNSLLRSALFGSSRTRKFVKESPIASWKGTEIAFTGERLNQFDESLWFQLVHLHRGQQVHDGHAVHTSARALMKDLGIKTAGGSGWSRLRSSLIRLAGSVLTMTSGDETIGISALVRRFYLNEGTGRYSVELNPDFLKLLNEDSVTRIDWETRKALPTGLATWLHRYILSHKATARHPHRIGLAQLRQLSGMNSPPRRFKQHLKEAMNHLGTHEVLAHWRITPQNSLEFSRPPKRRRAGFSNEA